MDIIKHNKMAWDHEVGHHNRWTIPVSNEIIAEASQNATRILKR